MNYEKLFFFFSCYVFYINLLLYINKTSVLNMKNSDLKLIQFFKLSYKNISFYLNSKYIINYFYNENLKTEKTTINKKIIQLFFINFHCSNYQQKQINDIKQILSRKFEIVINPQSPEYLIYNVFGCLHLNEKYNNSIKIAYYTENEIPDFNFADYAIGQAHINYLDRYLRIPYLFGLSYNYANSKMFYLRKLVINKKRREKFCAAVISNHHFFSRFRLMN